ncbi:DUF7333 family protein [Haloarchaeobius litoreus]|uniref:PEP-CTERM protein-sorting domain-containing protein n=1 Tax=Haloarchaeobius litoreus TaxID=755306 RepID=A0ABD6DF62_9EURY|nr:hypothetical protein [Haloarchaeobius litoreus]
MELDQTKTAVAFLALIVVGTGALLAMQVMPTETTLMMVTPSMLVFGLVCLGIGVAHGEYRATH